MFAFRNTALAFTALCAIGWSSEGVAQLSHSSSGLRAPEYVPGGWQSFPDVPTALADSAAGEINGIIYVAGGIGSSGPSGALQAYNPEAQTWATLASLPETLYQSNGAATIDSQLYVAGGWNGSLPTDTLYVYDPPSNSWSTKASMSHLSACGVTGVINTMLYVTTACNGNSRPPYVKDLDVYDPATDTWTSLKDSTAAHSQPAGAVINGLLYVAGGLNGKGVTGVTEVYNPATNTWTKLASMPAPVVSPASAELDGKLYVFGGYNGTSALSTIQIYDPYKNRWTTSKVAMLAPTNGATAVVTDGIAFVQGGGDTENEGANVALFVTPSIP